MAVLKLQGDQRVELGSIHVVGRSRVCDLRLQRPSVSSLHAELVWDGESWRVQDLGSRNGTFLDDRRLTPGERAALVEGSQLAFGELEPRFVLVDAAPPRLLARTPDGDVIVAENELLCLPSPEACELSIFRSADGTWQIEDEDETRELDDQETVIAGQRPWRICLPAATERTRELETEIDAARISLEFAFSRDGEHVSLTLHTRDGPTAVKFRSHLVLLATLARQRIADAAQPHLPASEHGWMYREDLLREFDIDVRLLNLWIYRARQQLAQFGVRGSGALIERRAGSRQLRVGITRLRVREA